MTEDINRSARLGDKISLRGAPSRQELADNLSEKPEGPGLWSRELRVKSVQFVQVASPGRGWFKVRLCSPAEEATKVTITAYLPEPPRVGQRMRVALFDLEGGE